MLLQYLSHNKKCEKIQINDVINKNSEKILNLFCMKAGNSSYWYYK